MPVSHPDIDCPGEEPLLPPSERSFFLAPIPGIMHYPYVIFGWQLLSCALAWSILAHNGEIPLSDTLASLISRYQSETTIIATLLATILSATTTWYFRFVFLHAQQLNFPFLPTSHWHAGFSTLPLNRQLSHFCCSVFRCPNCAVQ